MIRQIVVIFIAILCSVSYAQQGTASPYSFYGIGSLQFRGTVENRGMGGIGSYIDSLHINLINPASYTGKNLEAAPYNKESRPVKFTVAGTFTSTGLKTDSESQRVSSSSFDYLALSFPIGKFGAGFGLLPYTSVGYRLQDIDPLQNDRVDNRYEGEGGLNKAFLTLAYAINDNFSIGVNADYNFGNTENRAIRFTYDSSGNLIQFATRQDDRSDLSGLNFNFGAYYKGKITEKLDWSATATFAPESKLVSQNQRSISTITISSLGDEFVQNTIDIDLSQTNQVETELTLPNRLSFGLGVGEASKWFIGAEYVSQNTSVFSNPILNNINTIATLGHKTSYIHRSIIYVFVIQTFRPHVISENPL